MKITQGSFSRSQSDTGWTLFTNSDERTADYFVEYGEGVEYRNTPKVHVSLAGFDIIQGTNHRLEVSLVGEPQRSGFLLRFRTWGDTKVHKVFCNWIAFGNSN